MNPVEINQYVNPEIAAKLLEVSYEPEKRQELYKQKGLENLRFLDDYSNYNTHAYELNGAPILVHRGTALNKDPIGDILSDYSIFKGYGDYLPRVQKGKKITKELDKKYNKKTLQVGHSLGGAVAEYVGKDGDHPVLTYNLHALRNPLYEKYNPNQLNYMTQQDLVSKPFQYFSKNKRKVLDLNMGKNKPYKSVLSRLNPKNIITSGLSAHKVSHLRKFK
jgi:hypothetical protein